MYMYDSIYKCLAWCLQRKNSINVMVTLIAMILSLIVQGMQKDNFNYAGWSLQKAFKEKVDLQD
jgi:hypothetical protein